jgi:hypothetical protein
MKEARAGQDSAEHPAGFALAAHTVAGYTYGASRMMMHRARQGWHGRCS